MIRLYNSSVPTQLTGLWHRGACQQLAFDGFLSDHDGCRSNLQRSYLLRFGVHTISEFKDSGGRTVILCIHRGR